MRHRLVFTAAAVLAASDAAATDPLITGYRTGWPLVSPPGWYGPGPRGHNPAPGYYDWQYYGVAGGPTISPGFAGRGHGFGPNYFGIPGAAGSFWTNGFSLYGPPIPTFAPTPGSFGNADISRAYFGGQSPTLPANGAVVGIVSPNRRHPLQPALGWAGQFSPSPRHQPLTVSAYPPGVALVPGPAAVLTTGQPCVRLTVALPDPAAAVWVQNAATTQTGTERQFESPPLEAGREYEYELVARWTGPDGKPVAETRQVRATAGQTVRVSFGETPQK